MAPTETRKNSALIRCWPFGVGGLVGPLFAVALSRWMPFPFAVGASMFVCFSAAGWMYRAVPSRVRQGIGGSLTAILVPAFAAGLVGGVLAFLFPWR